MTEFDAYGQAPADPYRRQPGESPEAFAERYAALRNRAAREKIFNRRPRRQTTANNNRKVLS